MGVHLRREHLRWEHLRRVPAAGDLLREHLRVGLRAADSSGAWLAGGWLGAGRFEEPPGTVADCWAPVVPLDDVLPAAVAVGGAVLPIVPAARPAGGDKQCELDDA